ncbi:MAG: FAD-dependent oxidoreductase [Chromatiales bacterium]|nr:FAD-dependent oxidoreductase [Chromatiales bacterium]
MKTRAPSASATLNRRELLGAAAGLAGLSWPARRALAGERWDLIVIGGGTAGLPAAIFAAEHGRVLVIEKSAMLGGTLDRSTGQVAAAGTVFQQARGISDSPDAHYDDIMRINEGTSDPALTRLFVDHAGPTLNWLAANGYTVAPGHPVTGDAHDHYTVARYQWGTPGGWSIYRAMEPQLQRALESGHITTVLGSSAIELIQAPDGSMGGVVVEDASGQRIDYRAPRVLIASGGCASNPQLFEALHGVPLYAQVAHPNSQGAGLLLGLAAGGHIRGGDKYATLLGAIPADERFPSAPVGIAALNATLRQPWEILVNVHGQRFCREDHPSVHALEVAAAAQPGHRHWAIFDQRILESAPPLSRRWTREQQLQVLRNNPAFSSADSLGVLALRAGLDPQGLLRTVAAYNEALTQRRPDPFGLEHRPLPIVQPPFHAIRMQGWTLVSFAGLAVNERLQVTREDGRAIPGLYAAGEVIGAGATSGRAYVNGTLATSALTFGRLLGQTLLTADR